MAKKYHTNKSTSPRKTKVSPTNKTEGESLEEWQISLRRQAAREGTFDICSLVGSRGTYSVKNPGTDHEYKVVYHGPDSQWNYCSCMDFRTNMLGTCKHIEAVKNWIEEGNHRVYTTPPSYSSIYLSYRGQREVKLRIGADNGAEIKKLAEPYFTKKGTLRAGAEKKIYQFISDVYQLNDSFRVYPDALDFITRRRDADTRESMLRTVNKRLMNKLLKTKLYPYQLDGIKFAFKAAKSVIADEMGLGKTVQAIGTAELLRHHGMAASVLIVCPTSLKYQWKKEIERFTDSSVHVIEGHHTKRREQYDREEFYKIVSYNSLCNDLKVMKKMSVDMVIFDEVQRLKNWNTQISRAARRLESDYVVALSGTPLENRLEELYSVMQLVDQYRLGPLYRFMDNSIITGDNGKIVGYRNLNEIGEMIKPVLLRRTKAEVELQLPERIDKVLFVPMTLDQRVAHDELMATVSQIIAKWNRFHFLSEADRKRLLLCLNQMRMLADSTFILDQRTRHDTKVEEVVNIVSNTIASGDEKIVIFSQWERMTRLIAAELDKHGVGYENLNGSVPSSKRRDMVERFTDDPNCRVFLSTDAGSTGLNLQAASLLINIDLPWNPAVLEQRIARIYRIGQQRKIQVIKLVSADSIEERMLSTLDFKSNLFSGILDNGNDTIMLDDSRLDKVMETINGFAVAAAEEAESETIEADDETEVTIDEAVPYISDAESEEVIEDVVPVEVDAITAETELVTTHAPATGVASSSRGGASVSKSRDAKALLEEGVSFLSGLASVLSSPEATREFVDEIVTVDESTGKAAINIPVPDKETVTGILTLFSKFIN